MSSLDFAALPRGTASHPIGCVCRQHEVGIWAGHEPGADAIHLPNSPSGAMARERTERHFRVRFLRDLGPREWQEAVSMHRQEERREQERRWRKGLVLPSERISSHWLQGVRAGMWPDVRERR